MKAARWLYRGKQFWDALTARPQPEDLASARHILTPAQYQLFLRLQPSEQAHALHVMHKVRALSPEAPGDLLRAALLHDIGKVRHPLRTWERVVIVLGHTLFRKKAVSWGLRSPKGWAKPFVVAARHPAWGAEMAQAVGASPLVVSLILRHQAGIGAQPHTMEDRLLQILQSADDES